MSREFCQGSTAAQALEEPQRSWVLSPHPVVCSSSSPRGADGAGVARAGSAPLRSQLQLSVVHFQSRREAATFKVTLSTTPPHHLPLQPQRPVGVLLPASRSAPSFCLITSNLCNTAHESIWENTPNKRQCNTAGREGLLPQETVSHTRGGEELTLE